MALHARGVSRFTQFTRNELAKGIFYNSNILAPVTCSVWVYLLGLGSVRSDESDRRTLYNERAGDQLFFRRSMHTLPLQNLSRNQAAGTQAKLPVRDVHMIDARYAHVRKRQDSVK